MELSSLLILIKMGTFLWKHPRGGDRLVCEHHVGGNVVSSKGSGKLRTVSWPTRGLNGCVGGGITAAALTAVKRRCRSQRPANARRPSFVLQVTSSLLFEFSVLRFEQELLTPLLVQDQMHFSKTTVIVTV